MLSDFVNRFESNPSIWPVIEEIKKTCQVGLLTNAYPRMLTEIQRRGILSPIAWDVIIDSSVVGFQKPDRQIFEIAQEKAKINLKEILFVENSPEHVRAAQIFGWQTFLYDSLHPHQSSQKLLNYI